MQDLYKSIATLLYWYFYWSNTLFTTAEDEEVSEL